MTKKEAIRLHRVLWNWLADNPERHKTEWPGWDGYFLPKNDCFLCEYALSKDGCCLLDWEAPGKCYIKGSYYSLYDETTNIKQRAWLARKIANLKEKAKKET